MTFPLGMTSDGTVVVGTNLYNKAVIWNASDGATIVGDVNVLDIVALVNIILDN